MTRRTLVRTTATLASVAALHQTSTTIAAPAQTSRTATSAQDDDIQTDIELVLPLIPYGQPVTIDPHRTVNWGPFWTLFPYVWSGLLRFDEHGGIENDLADSVEANDDLTVWTAHLRDGISFASGRAISADDVILSWKRALDPTALTPMASFYAPIAGFAEYTTGKSEEIGFRSVDERTIEITLDEGLATFPYNLATFGFAILDSEVLANPDVADPFLADAGAGPWRITEFVDGDHLTLKPNDFHWDERSPSIATITWRILPSADAETIALDLYRNDEIASADVPLSLAADVAADETLSGELQTVAAPGSTLAIGLDFNQAPFDDVRIRRALAAAIDREAWANDIWGGSFTPATGFVPPVAEQVTGYTSPDGIAHDVDAAKQLLADAEFDPTTDAPDIVYYEPATDSADTQQRHAQLLTAIQDAIGLTIRHDTSLTAEQIASLQADNGGRQFDLVWWWPDGEPIALLDRVGLPDSPYMAGWFNWSPDIEATDDGDPGADAASFADAIARANATDNRDERNAAYQDAEKLLLDDAVYIPLGYWNQRFVQKPWLVGTRQGAWTGRIPVRIDKDVVVRGKPE